MLKDFKNQDHEPNTATRYSANIFIAISI